MSELTDNILSDVRDLREKGSWEAPYWAVTRAKELNVKPDSPKIIEWGLMQVIVEMEKHQAITATEFEAVVEKRVAERLRELGVKLTHGAGVVAVNAKNKVVSLGSFVGSKLKSAAHAVSQASQDKDPPQPPAAA